MCIDFLVVENTIHIYMSLNIFGGAFLSCVSVMHLITHCISLKERASLYYWKISMTVCVLSSEFLR